MTGLTLSNSLTIVQRHAFYGCTALASVTIPNSVEEIWSSAFEGCSSLSSLTIGSGVTAIGNNAFRSTGVVNVTLPDGVTSISQGLFRYCTSLTRITFGSGISSIGAYAFNGCNAGAVFDFRRAASVPTLTDVNAFLSTTSNKEIIVPDSLYDTWIAAENWNSTTNSIVGCTVRAGQSSLGSL